MTVLSILILISSVLILLLYILPCFSDDFPLVLRHCCIARDWILPRDCDHKYLMNCENFSFIDQNLYMINLTDSVREVASVVMLRMRCLGELLSLHDFSAIFILIV